MSYCTIKSPIDGVVVDRKVDIGQTVQASMTTPQFFTLATDLTTLKLSADVDEADIGSIRPNMPVDFTVDAYPNQTFTGTVDSVRLNATSSNNVVTYPVWITVKNPDLKLRPSMTATLRIIVDTAPNVLRIPNQALRFRPTAEMYTWLQLPAPPPGQGRGTRGLNAGGAGRQGVGGQGANAVAGGRSAQAAPGAPADASAASGRRNRPNGGNGGSGQGFGLNGPGGGRGGNFANMTPEEMAAMRQRFGGGRNGGGGGRNGGGRGGAGMAGNSTPLTERNAAKIDDLYMTLPKRIQGGQVWVYDPTNADPAKRLVSIPIRVGLTDTQMTELVSGSLKAGMQVVTGVIPPPSALSSQSQTNNPFQPQRGGFRGGGGFGGGGRGRG